MRHIVRFSTAFISAAAVLALGELPGPASAAGDQDGWVQLFNGKDLTGWDTWLNKLPGENEPIGLNKDPLGVYKVEDGAIHISGQVFGALTSQREYENYHLRVEFKWGEKKWPPRENAVRDSGVLYHCVGPHGAAGGNWMRSQECQVQEHDCGDYYSVAGGIVDVEAERVGEKKNQLKHTKGGELVVGHKARIIKSEDHEKPTGEWNVIEVIADGGTCTHVVNGVVVMVMTNSRQVVEGKEVPLTQGKIQLQSEGAEVWYRKVEIKPLK